MEAVHHRSRPARRSAARSGAPSNKACAAAAAKASGVATGSQAMMLESFMAEIVEKRTATTAAAARLGTIVFCKKFFIAYFAQLGHHL
jgi:hypothetical protein